MSGLFDINKSIVESKQNQYKKSLDIDLNFLNMYKKKHGRIPPVTFMGIGELFQDMDQNFETAFHHKVYEKEYLKIIEDIKNKK